MERLFASLEDGIRDGFSGVIDKKRQGSDPAYAGGIKIGECRFVQFMAITRDYPLDFSMPQEEAGDWLRLLALDREFQDCGPEIMQLEHLEEEELVSAPAAIWPFDGNFNDQMYKSSGFGLDIYHNALC